MWDDNWTILTNDGKYSAQFEHTILITENGHEILTQQKNQFTLRFIVLNKNQF